MLGRLAWRAGRLAWWTARQGRPYQGFRLMCQGAACGFRGAVAPGPGKKAGKRPLPRNGRIAAGTGSIHELRFITGIGCGREQEAYSGECSAL